MEDMNLEFPSLLQYKEEEDHWIFPLRREMQEILPELVLGPYCSTVKSKLPVLHQYAETWNTAYNFHTTKY
uniref:Uncharacterized protein n=1 Tax=Sciurus vulgaris TaxID=55149 RepID=A0A8D2DTW1_SCIVU